MYTSSIHKESNKAAIGLSSILLSGKGEKEINTHNRAFIHSSCIFTLSFTFFFIFLSSRKGASGVNNTHPGWNRSNALSGTHAHTHATHEQRRSIMTAIIDLRPAGCIATVLSSSNSTAQQM